MVDRKARYERRQRAKDQRNKDSRRDRRRNLRRTILAGSGMLAVAVAVIGVFVVLGLLQKELPPTNFGPNHSESLPPQQINRSPIPRPIQEHVMERNRTHPPGQMLVQYNCREYDCAPDLVEMLVKIVSNYPPSVYLAPYPSMDAKIALAAPGKLLTLDTLDEVKIINFINENLDR